MTYENIKFYNVYKGIAMNPPEEILEFINFGITVIFIVLYCCRLKRLRHFATTQLHKQKYNRIRTFLCLPYAILSIPFFVMSLIYKDYEDDNPDVLQKFWVIELPIGQFLDGIVLIMQILVLRSQLKKQRPYTCVHLTFCIYLTCISIARLAVVLVNIGKKTTNLNPYQITCAAFYFVFLVNAIVLLVYWIAKRQQLPQFKQLNNFKAEDFNRANTFYSINCNIEISRLSSRNTSMFTFIKPTVLISQGKFRIILEIPKEDSSIRQDLSIQRDNNKGLGRDVEKQKYKIISTKLYEINQIIQLYKLCGRFSIQTKLNFSSDMGVLIKSLQSFLDEFFNNKKHYLSFCLKYFDLPQTYIDECERSLRNSIKESELDIVANIDKNASIISIAIFKQLWIDDYYLFYLDVMIIDDKIQSRPMKRYHDFEIFHNQLLSIIKKRYNNKLELPNLPKKYLFNLDQEKINHRRMELGIYLKSLTNDHKLMIGCQDIRIATLQFLGFTINNLTPVYQQFQEFYKKIQIHKGQITKRLTNNQYVTYYQFKVLEGGVKLKFIKKRFNDFLTLHNAIERWMKNTQINYKFLVLPQKHLYKSGIVRHQKLKLYLETLIKIQDIYLVYEVNSFFEVGNTTIKDIQISSIDDRQSKSSGDQYEESPKANKFLDQQSFQSKERMSALIDLLGN